MGAISQAIAALGRGAGAEIRTGAEVASIDVRDGRAVGVTLADGEEIRAPIVASGAHPKTTVLDLDRAPRTSPTRSPRTCAATEPAAAR